MMIQGIIFEMLNKLFICSGNILNHPVKKYLNYSIFQKLNNSNRVHNDGFFIGNHPADIKKELYKVKKIFDSFN